MNPQPFAYPNQPFPHDHHPEQHYHNLGNQIIPRLKTSSSLIPTWEGMRGSIGDQHPDFPHVNQGRFPGQMDNCFQNTTTQQALQYLPQKKQQSQTFSKIHNNHRNDNFLESDIAADISVNMGHCVACVKMNDNWPCISAKT